MWPIIPDWMHDWTNELPWHSKDDPRFNRELKRMTKRGKEYNKPLDDKRWFYRKKEAIKGVCFHQSFGHAYNDPKNTNNYHIGPNHISSTGCPHICYTIFVGREGDVYLCNPFHAITWSQGDKDQPGSENRMLVSVVLAGRFSNAANITYGSPTVAQLEASMQVWKFLRDAFELTEADLFGHFDFGKSGCPGFDLENWIVKTRSDSGLLVLSDVKDWQKALIKIGYDPGKIDGVWGYNSKKALIDFQKDYQLNPSGVFDRPTAWMIRMANEGKVEFIEFEDEAIVL